MNTFSLNQLTNSQDSQKNELIINAPILNFEHIKLYVRLPIDLKVDTKYSYILLTSVVNNTTYFCTGIVTHSVYTRSGTIDITSDIAHTLHVKANDTICYKYISMDKVCTELVLESKNNVQCKIEVLSSYLLQKPVMEGMVIYHKKDRLKIKKIKYVVNNDTQYSSLNVAIITKNTNIIISSKTDIQDISFSEIGGLEKEINQLRDILELPLTHKALFDKMKVKAPKGILLYGPPGTGKTMLAKAVANIINASFHSISAPSIATKYYGQSENKLRTVFEKASQNTPSILFIDEIDAIAAKRESSSEVDKRICTQLLVLMDGLNSNDNVIVLAATNIIDSLDDAVRRGGRFDIEMKINLPSEQGRFDILTKILAKPKVHSDVNISNLSKITNGYSGADLAALVRHASLTAIKKHVAEPSQLLRINDAILKESVKKMESSIMKQIGAEKSNISLDSVVGQDQIIKEILLHLELSQKYKIEFNKRSAKLTTGILLYGIPGTGKTLMAKAIANRLNYSLVYIKGPELLSRYVGVAEKEIRNIFERAKLAAPSLIVLDEMDAMASARDNDATNSNTILSQLLTELSDIQQYAGELAVIGITNRPDLIDPAILRIGRFDFKYQIKPPTKTDLIALLTKIGSNYNTILTDPELEQLATTLYVNKCTGGAVELVFKNAFVNLLQDVEKKVVSEYTTIPIIYLKNAVDRLVEQNSVGYVNMKVEHNYY